MGRHEVPQISKLGNTAGKRENLSAIRGTKKIIIREQLTSDRRIRFGFRTSHLEDRRELFYISRCKFSSLISRVLLTLTFPSLLCITPAFLCQCRNDFVNDIPHRSPKFFWYYFPLTTPLPNRMHRYTEHLCKFFGTDVAWSQSNYSFVKDRVHPVLLLFKCFQGQTPSFLVKVWLHALCLET